MVTSLILLNPKLASWTLFELFPLNKVHKLQVVVSGGVGNLELLAGHVFVPLYPTV